MKRTPESREEVSVEEGKKKGMRGRKRGEVMKVGEVLRFIYIGSEFCVLFCFFSPSSSRAEQATMTKRADGRGN